MKFARTAYLPFTNKIVQPDNVHLMLTQRRHRKDVCESEKNFCQQLQFVVRAPKVQFYGKRFIHSIHSSIHSLTDQSTIRNIRLSKAHHQKRATSTTPSFLLHSFIHSFVSVIHPNSLLPEHSEKRTSEVQTWCPASMSGTIHGIMLSSSFDCRGTATPNQLCDHKPCLNERNWRTRRTAKERRGEEERKERKWNEGNDDDST